MNTGLVRVLPAVAAVAAAVTTAIQAPLVQAGQSAAVQEGLARGPSWKNWEAWQHWQDCLGSVAVFGTYSAWRIFSGRWVNPPFGTPTETRGERVILNALTLAAATFMSFFPMAAVKFHVTDAPYYLVPLVGGGCGLLAGALPAFMNRCSATDEKADEKPIEAFARLGLVGLVAGLATLIV